MLGCNEHCPTKEFMALKELRSLTRVQRNTFTACFLSWSLDAFDFFLLTLCVKAIATEFHV